MYLDWLILKVPNVRLETVGGPHPDGEEVMIVILELLAEGALSDEQLNEIPEAVD